MTSAGDPLKLPVTEVREAEGCKLTEDGQRTILLSVCVEGWGTSGDQGVSGWVGGTSLTYYPSLYHILDLLAAK